MLSGENGHDRLKKIQQKLRMRQQYMLAQVASIYPVRTLDEHIPMKTLDSRSSGSQSTGLSLSLPPPPSRSPVLSFSLSRSLYLAFELN